MKTEKEIKQAIENMRKKGNESDNDVEKKILLEKMGALTWVLK